MRGVLAPFDGHQSALLRLAVRRVLGRLRAAPQRVLLSLLGVAFATALVVAVTGVSLGLASESVVQSDETDYWIVPEGATVQSLAIQSGGVKLGNVHTVSAGIQRDSRVEYATPVLLTVLALEDRKTSETRHILAVGVIPGEETELFGLSTGPLTDGDPYYANGSYSGRWTGEAVLNTAAAETINASTGSRLEAARTGSEHAFDIANVSAGAAGPGFGSAPVAIVHLSELQAVTGTASSDQADQILVDANDPTVEGWLDSRYPRTSVVTQRGLATQEVSTSNLPLAVAIAAFLSASVVGVLFIATLMGLEVSADRNHLGTLAAVGFSDRSRSLLIGYETLVIALVGGVLGVVIGSTGIGLVNWVVDDQFGVRQIAVFDPLLVVYGLAIAVVVGVVGSLYPIYLARRLKILEVLTR